jgi:tRNA-specific 2-thiouridylase
VDEQGHVLGTHEGYPFYTVGQRKGLGIALGYPVFVTAIDKELNRVVLGKDTDLMKNTMLVNQLRLMKYENLNGRHIETTTKVRYKDAGTPALIEQIGDEMHVKFHDWVSAIAPGQAAVFYEGDDVIGGGWIKSGGRI